jgi:hypothetical protein
VKKARTKRSLKSGVTTEKDAWGVAEAYGVNMKLLEDNLRRTPDERLAVHGAVLDLIEVLERCRKSVAARKRRARQAKLKGRRRSVGTDG